MTVFLLVSFTKEFLSKPHWVAMSNNWQNKGDSWRLPFNNSWRFCQVFILFLTARQRYFNRECFWYVESNTTDRPFCMLHFFTFITPSIPSPHQYHYRLFFSHLAFFLQVLLCKMTSSFLLTLCRPLFSLSLCASSPPVLIHLHFPFPGPAFFLSPPLPILFHIPPLCSSHFVFFQDIWPPFRIGFTHYSHSIILVWMVDEKFGLLW